MAKTELLVTTAAVMVKTTKVGLSYSLWVETRFLGTATKESLYSILRGYGPLLLILYDHTGDGSELSYELVN